MGGDQDELLRWIEPGPVAALEAAFFQTVAHVEDGVDAGVAGDGDSVRGHALAAEIPGRAFGGGKVQRGQRRRQHAVHLFGEGLAQVVGAQPGFDVGNGNALVKGGERAAECGGGIPLYDHQIRPPGGEHRLKAGQHARSRLRQRLAGLHQVEIVIGDDVEDGQHLIEHLAVLRGDAHANVERAAVGAQIVH